MDATLEITSGPLANSAFAITREAVSLGTDSSNDLSIYDLSLAAKHCLITQLGGAYQVIDLDSQAGTFVNDIPIKVRILQDGDVIRIGESEMVFRGGSENALEEEEPTPEGGVVVDLFPAGILHERSFPPPLVTDVGRMARDLNALFKVARTINSHRDLESLQKGILQLLMEVVPADGGALLLMNNVEAQPTSTLTWMREGREHLDFTVRRDLVVKALWERSEVLAKDTSEAQRPESVLCVPLVALQKVIGVIYLVALDTVAGFETDHVNFTVAVAAIAAVTLESVLMLESLRLENRQLREQLAADQPMIGESKQMRQLAEMVDKVARGDSAVLIRGESGTGKEMVARAIHQNSSRSAQPFIAINCAAIPENLIESELFGHEKGAFTGAVGMKRGKVELAAGGTLFLDEIGELDPKLQAKLLRVLQEREFERIGGTSTIRFNARVLAATNKDLEEAIKTREFRQDLFYRLNVVSVTLPPLREHREDIPLLAMHFARKYSQRLARPFKGISAEARALLTNYRWPGNVRELENAIEHALVMGSSETIVPIDLPQPLLNEEHSSGKSTKYYDAVQQFKRRLVNEAMNSSGSNYNDAARLLGVHPNYLYRLIRKLSLKSTSQELGPGNLE